MRMRRPMGEDRPSRLSRAGPLTSVNEIVSGVDQFAPPSTDHDTSIEPEPRVTSRNSAGMAIHSGNSLRSPLSIVTGSAVPLPSVCTDGSILRSLLVSVSSANQEPESFEVYFARQPVAPVEERSCQALVARLYSHVP